MHIQLTEHIRFIHEYAHFALFISAATPFWEGVIDHKTTAYMAAGSPIAVDQPTGVTNVKYPIGGSVYSSAQL